MKPCQMTRRACKASSGTWPAWTKEERKIVFASSLGTAFEWYDFLVFASLSPVIASKFFAPLSPEIAFIFALLTFSAAYAVRPLGALVFGRIGVRHAASARACPGTSSGYAPVPAAAQLLLDANHKAGTIRQGVTIEDFFLAIAGIWQIEPRGDWQPRLGRLMNLVMDGLRVGAPGSEVPTSIPGRSRAERPRSPR